MIDLFIHQQPDWPGFQWETEALAEMLAAVRYRQGRHLGKMEGIGFELRREASLTALTEEVVKSSAIEGENLDHAEVRSSIARSLGLDVAGLPHATREVESIVQMMLDATQKFKEPLTEERLFDWHAALFPTGRSSMGEISVGAWRSDQTGPMRVVSGRIGRETVHLEAPAAERLELEMARFLDWFNSDRSIDPVLKAGVGHLWFVTIHPFDDGNGRIARAVAEMLLSRADGTMDRFYSMSAGIESERKSYYHQLESTQRGGLNITNWLKWFLGCLDRAIERSDRALQGVLRKARLWQSINLNPINERQRRVINRMLDQFKGHLTTSKYARLAKCSTDTALRDIRELLKQGVMAKNTAGGRSTSYRLAHEGDAPSGDGA